MSAGRRLFDSSSLVTPPAPEIEASTYNRLLTPEKSANLRQLFSVKMYRMSAPVGYTLLSEELYRVRSWRTKSIL